MAGFPTITPRTQPNGRRVRVLASSRLLHEFIRLNYAANHTYYELRLGPTTLLVPGVQLTPSIEAALRVRNWYADAVTISPLGIMVWEAAMLASPSKISQVLHYVSLIRTTPVLNDFTTLPVRPAVLFAVDDPTVHAAAVAAGVEVFVYSPFWVEQYLELKYFNRRHGPPARFLFGQSKPFGPGYGP